MAILTVTNTNDAGAGSLRAAIASANADVNADTIVFAQALAGQTIVLSALSGNLAIIQGALTIDGDLNGDGDSDITISGGNLTDILNIAAPAIVSLNSLRLINGRSSTSGEAGGIRNNGNLTLNYSELGGNNSDLSLAHTGESTAGGIVNAGVLSINHSVFDGNSGLAANGADGIATAGSPGGSAAGAILNLSGGTLNLDAVAFFAGSATGGKGGKGGSLYNSGVTVGYYGGDGGHAASAILNLGTMAGEVGNNITRGTSATAGLAGGLTFYGNQSGVPPVDGSATFSNANLTNNTFAVDFSLIQVALGSQYADTVNGIMADQRFDGLGGADIITGSGGSILYGGGGNDTLTAQGGAAVYGGKGNDILANAFLSNGVWDGG
jgi:hypothetical protein